jgi:hypothetical protein
MITTSRLETKLSFSNYCFTMHPPSGKECIYESYIRGSLAKQNYYNKESVLLTSSFKQTTIPSDDFSLQIDSAIARYKRINNIESYDRKNAEPFLSALKPISAFSIQRITFYDDAVKTRISFKEREFIIDYDFEEPDAVFVSTFVNEDTLAVKDGALTDLLSLLEAF